MHLHEIIFLIFFLIFMHCFVFVIQPHVDRFHNQVHWMAEAKKNCFLCLRKYYIFISWRLTRQNVIWKYQVNEFRNFLFVRIFKSEINFDDASRIEIFYFIHSFFHSHSYFNWNWIEHWIWKWNLRLQEHLVKVFAIALDDRMTGQLEIFLPFLFNI